MSAKTVFISYSHDSDEHRERVLALSERLRKDGITTLLDQYENGSPQQGWPRWMLDQLDRSDAANNKRPQICTDKHGSEAEDNSLNQNSSIRVYLWPIFSRALWRQKNPTEVGTLNTCIKCAKLRGIRSVKRIAET